MSTQGGSSCCSWDQHSPAQTPAPKTTHTCFDPGVSTSPDDVQGEAEGSPLLQEQQVDAIISSLPLIRYLRSPRDAQAQSPAYREARPYRSLHHTARDTHLVAGSLFGPSKLPVDPYFFIRTREPYRVIATCFVGTHLCGHPGYVHGGLNFLLFDDIFARCASLVFGGKAAMTANMNLDFRKPSTPNRVYIYRAEITKLEGRKAWVAGQMRCLKPYTTEDLMSRDASTSDELSAEEEESELVAEAQALFIEPKFGKSMVALFTDE